MKKTKKNISILILASLTIMMFVGCSSYKKMGNSSNAGTTNKTGMTGNTDNTNEQISYQTTAKKLYSNAIKPLVTDGTITQSQSDKVLFAITKNMSSDTGTSIGTTNPGTPRTTTPNKDTPSTGTPSIGTPGATSSGTPGTGTTGGKMLPNITELSKLVKSGVITQTQANTINQKLQDATITGQGSQTE
mgnify:CR=1 FL=1